MTGGRLFQTRGPATANALSPSDVVVRGISSIIVSCRGYSEKTDWRTDQNFFRHNFEGEPVTPLLNTALVSMKSHVAKLFPGTAECGQSRSRLVLQTMAVYSVLPRPGCGSETLAGISEYLSLSWTPLRGDWKCGSRLQWWKMYE